MGSISSMVRISTPVSEILMVGSKIGTLTLFSLNDSCLVDVDQIKLGSSIHSMSPNSAGDEVLSVTAAGSFFRVKTKQLAYTLFHKHPSGEMKHVSFPFGSSDHVLTCSQDTDVTLWDLNDYSARIICGGRSFPVPSCSVGSADVIVAGYRDATVRAYGTEGGTPLWHIDNVHKGGVTTVNLAQNMRFFVSGGVEGELRVWEIKGKTMIAHLKEHSQNVNDCHLFANDQFAISCGKDHCLFTWDLRNQRRLTAHREKHGGINELALASDQTSVVTVGAEKNITFWDLRDAYPVASIEVDEEMRTIDMSYDGKYICTGGSCHLLKLWDQRQMSSGPVAVGRGHSRDIISAKFARDDKQIVSAATDHSILVWNLYG